MSTERARKLPLDPEDDSGNQLPASEGSATGMPRLLTVRELATFLGLHEKTIYDWTARGELPCLRLGNRLRFEPNDVLRWLSAQKGG